MNPGSLKLMSFANFFYCIYGISMLVVSSFLVCFMLSSFDCFIYYGQYHL